MLLEGTMDLIIIIIINVASDLAVNTISHLFKNLFNIYRQTKR